MTGQSAAQRPALHLRRTDRSEQQWIASGFQKGPILRPQSGVRCKRLLGRRRIEALSHWDSVQQSSSSHASSETAAWYSPPVTDRSSRTMATVPTPTLSTSGAPPSNRACNCHDVTPSTTMVGIPIRAGSDAGSRAAVLDAARQISGRLPGGIIPSCSSNPKRSCS
jgi:hypothetical protein